MRTRLAATVSKLDLKRREGGIAEIEFATRLLQLRHVAGNPDLERGGVFGALAVLAEKGLLSELACETLRAGYAFFRHLLNRARMMRGSSSSCLPESPDILQRLALGLGVKEDLLEKVESHAVAVHDTYRAIYESLYEEI